MKSMKKLVLVGLILLASVMVLAGCKNDSVPEVPKYTVQFNKNADDATGTMENQLFTQDVKQALKKNGFTRNGYTFTGWKVNDSETSYKDEEEIILTSDVELLAQWQANQVEVSVSAPENPSEGKISMGENYTFTAIFGKSYETYTWFVEGEKQNEKSNTFTLDTSDLAAGPYEIRVEVEDNDARIKVEVRK